MLWMMVAFVFGMLADRVAMLWRASTEIDNCDMWDTERE